MDLVLGDGLKDPAEAFDDQGIASGDDQASDAEAGFGFDFAPFEAVGNGGGRLRDGLGDDFGALLFAESGEIGAVVCAVGADAVATGADCGGGFSASAISLEEKDFGDCWRGWSVGIGGEKWEGDELNFLRVIATDGAHRRDDIEGFPEIIFAVEEPPVGQIFEGKVWGVGEFDHGARGFASGDERERGEHEFALCRGERGGEGAGFEVRDSGIGVESPGESREGVGPREGGACGLGEGGEEGGFFSETTDSDGFEGGAIGPVPLVGEF